MSRSARWQPPTVKDGVMEVALTSWKYFHDYVRQEMLEYSHYVWRGQRDALWTLESSLDRQLRLRPIGKLARARTHLAKFKQSVRGRRGANPTKIEDDNEWWALGQHHGLATPLLDWTESPFVALYFAYEKPQRPPSGLRSVWAIANPAQKNREIVEAHKAKTPTPTTPPPTLDFVRPHQDENARLVAQAGLFTKAPLGGSVDSWFERTSLASTKLATL
jgi:hypothetical protein